MGALSAGFFAQIYKDYNYIIWDLMHLLLLLYTILWREAGLAGSQGQLSSAGY